MSECWIVEKPSAAQDIAAILFGGKAGQTGPVTHTKTGPDLVVTVGHAITLADPDEYDPAYKTFDKFDVARLLTQGRRMVPSKERGSDRRRTDVPAMLARIRKATKIVIATDAGREGEMIAWELIEEAGYRGPVQRLWTSSTSPEAYRRAHANLLNGDEKKPLYWAGLARSIADYSEGYSFTRIFSKKNTAFQAGVRPKPLSIGRVQTAVVAIIDDRCRTIESFVPTTYYEIVANVETATGMVTLTHRPPADRRITDEAEAHAIAAAAQGTVTRLSVKTTRKHRPPPHFSSTSGLQKRCYSAFGMSPEKTLNALQILYDPTHTTYPRTECIYLSDDHPPLMQPMLDQLATLPGIRDVAARHPAWFANAIIRKEWYDSSKLTDHHAITPDKNYPLGGAASLPRDPKVGQEDLWKVYDLIARTTIAQLLPDMAYDSTTISAIAGGKTFGATGQVVVDPGWTVMFPDKANDDSESKKARRKKAPADDADEEGEGVTLPPVRDGESGRFAKVAVARKATEPPPYFTMGSIVDAMVNVDLYVDDKRARELLIGKNSKQKKGIGTGATRGAIITKIFDRGYVHLDRKALKTTPRGRGMVGLVRKLIPWMADPIHTATQEGILLDIEGRRADHVGFIDRTLRDTSSTIDRLVALDDRTIVSDGPPPTATRTPAGRPAGGGHRGATRPPAKGRPGAPPPGGAATRPKQPATQRQPGATYFKVAYAEKEEAKALGMRWDGGAQLWYAPDPTSAAKATARFKAA